MTEAELAEFGQRPKKKPSNIKKPPGSPTITIRSAGPNQHILSFSHEDGSPHDESSEHGIRVVHGAMPFGGATQEQADGPLKLLKKPPKTAKDLRNGSFFTGKSSYTVTHDPEYSGMEITYCACYENAKGDAGPWSVMESAILGGRSFGVPHGDGEK
jgi:hypothetical protein